ncbi:MAG: MFS transporter, partial [Eggerthellaceae bacterium]|nr:MFS transporter [Eggerthellaceae bacterium]
MNDSTPAEPIKKKPRSNDASELCPHPWAAVWSLLIGFFMLMIDMSIVSVANPSIQSGLGASLTETIWVTSAYLLGLAAPLLIAGRLGDRFGQRTMFFLGMVIFTLSSLVCGLAPSVSILIVARAVQGIGGSFMSPQSQATIVRIFPPHRRGAAMGLWGSVSGIAMLIGPMLGGFLVQSAGWQSIFLINVPVGVVGSILVLRFVPKLPTSRPRL